VNPGCDQVCDRGDVGCRGEKQHANLQAFCAGG
jgi:hypothetical protein